MIGVLVEEAGAAHRDVRSHPAARKPGSWTWVTPTCPRGLGPGLRRGRPRRPCWKSPATSGCGGWRPSSRRANGDRSRSWRDWAFDQQVPTQLRPTPIPMPIPTSSSVRGQAAMTATSATCWRRTGLSMQLASGSWRPSESLWARDTTVACLHAGLGGPGRPRAGDGELAATCSVAAPRTASAAADLRHRQRGWRRRLGDLRRGASRRETRQEANVFVRGTRHLPDGPSSCLATPPAEPSPEGLPLKSSALDVCAAIGALRVRGADRTVHSHAQPISIRTQDGTCPAHVFRPDGRDPRPAVLFYIDRVSADPPGALPDGERLAASATTCSCPTCSTGPGLTGPWTRRPCSPIPAKRAEVFQLHARGDGLDVMRDSSLRSWMRSAAADSRARPARIRAPLSATAWKVACPCPRRRISPTASRRRASYHGGILPMTLPRARISWRRR